MTLTYNILMAIFASITFFVSVEFFFRERELGLFRYIVLVMGTCCTLGNAGYMIMSVSGINNMTLFTRNVGIWGIDLYIFIGLTIIVGQLKNQRKFKLIMYPTFTAILLGTFWFHSLPGDLTFYMEDGFVTFESNHTIGFYFQTLYTFIGIIYMTYSCVIWYRQQITKRAKLFIILIIISSLFYTFTSLPYFLGIKTSHPAFLYCLGTTLSCMVLWYAGVVFSGFQVTPSQISSEIYSSINMAVLVFDTYGKLIIANNYAKKNLGIELKKGQSLSDIFNIHPEEESSYIRNLMDFGSNTIRCKSKDKKKSYALNVNLKRDSFTDPTCIICVVNDMTGEEQMIAEVVAANKAKSEFLASMSHEIRTPINAVLGMNELIKRESTENQIVSYAKDVESSGKLLLSLINNILDFSKIESGKMELVKSDYDPVLLINETVTMMQQRAKDKGLKFLVEVDSSLPSRLNGDEVRVKQIMTNLLTNAIKYTENGGVKMTIDSSISGKKANITIAVADTGKGIKKEDQLKLFDSFTRVDEIKNRSIEGTGLGLTLTQSFVKSMDGHLEVESTYGKGSVFTAYIKQDIVNEEPIGDYHQHITETKPEKDKKTCVLSATDVRVLAVDDIEMNCKVFAGLLKNTGIMVDFALSGKEAIEKARVTTYDLIFMDHMMPQMDGVEAFHHIRMEGGSSCKTPVIVLTANAVAGAKENYLREGFSDFLAKPILPKQLEELIIKFLPEKVAYIELTEEELYALKSKNKSENIDISSSDEDKVTPENSDSTISLPYVEGFDWDTSMTFLQSEDTIKDIALTFAGDIDETIETLCACSADIKNPESLSNYRIKAHSTKSSLKMLGCQIVSDLARDCEFAARDSKLDDIKDLTPQLVEKLKAIKEGLKVLEN